jgi:hypothetical protein
LSKEEKKLPPYEDEDLLTDDVINRHKEFMANMPPAPPMPHNRMDGTSDFIKPSSNPNAEFVSASPEQ